MGIIKKCIGNTPFRPYYPLSNRMINFFLGVVRSVVARSEYAGVVYREGYISTYNGVSTNQLNYRFKNNVFDGRPVDSELGYHERIVQNARYR